MSMGVERRFGRPPRDESVTRRRRLRRCWLALAQAALLLASSRSALAQSADSDQDGLPDAWELEYFGDLSPGVADDPDGDGLFNQAEQRLGSAPTRFDTDGDALSDRRERDLGTSPTLSDTDRDGLSDYAEVVFHRTDPLLRDTDDGGRGDGEEVRLDGTDPLDREDDLLDSDGDGLSNTVEQRLGTDPFAADSDGDLLGDGEENPDLDDTHQGDDGDGVFEPGAGEETDPRLADTDGDRLNDGLERFFGSDPYALDSDGDGYGDGDEFERRSVQTPCLNPALPDSDFDGVGDGVELDGGLSPCRPDTDGDNVLDAVELEIGTDPLVPDAPPDADGDGLPDDYEIGTTLTDPNEVDTDGDGVSDPEELYPLSDRAVTDPNDADTDDDGLLDGNERNLGSTSPVDADTDDDGLLDGLERGLVAPQSSALDPDATDLTVFVADSAPGTTNPLLRDSDGDGLSDGEEDADGDGARDPDETDPILFDTDADGMDDGWERRYGTGGLCPAGTTLFMDGTVADAGADNDGDGLTNVAEYVLEVRLGIQLVRAPTSPCDADTDDDGLDDALEAFSAYGGGQTNPTASDTDGDGLGDGLEDANADGALGDTETDPTDDDSDADGLGDSTEDADRDGQVDPGETDPRLPDSDDDGVGDGAEVLQYGTDPLDPDSDDDGIPDGVELGTARDADPTTVTDPRRADSDGDTLVDGDEDQDRNGRRDAEETDPADYDTDDGGASDGDELERGTDPLDPSDDGAPSEPPPGPDAGAPPPPPDAGSPDADADAGAGAAPPSDLRGTLEPNGEIRGSGLCGLGRAPAPPTPWLPLAAALALWLRTRRRAAQGLLLALLGVGAALVPRVARAQLIDPASARNTNIDANPHRLDPSGYDLLGTSRPRVLSHLGVRGAAVLNHLSGPAVVADRDSGDTLRALVGNRQEVSLGASVGLFERAQVSLMLPAVLHQRADLPGQGLADASSGGLGNPTLVPRAIVLEGEGGAPRLGVELPITLPLWETPAYMGYEGWGVEPRILAEELAGPVIISLSFGALLKPDQRIFNLHDGDQLTYALAVQYPEALRDWDFGLEFLGGTPLDRPGRGTATRGELLGGARHRFDPRLSVTGGLGAGLFSGIGQPSYRIFVAVGYAFTGAAEGGQGSFRPECVPQPGQPLPADCPPIGPDADGDGVGDATDVCPTELEDLDMYADGDGCPDPDNDGDGLLDGDDGCPADAEDADGFNDVDGCPDPDNDGDGLLDGADRCPLDAEDLDGELDEDGCPDLPYGSELPTTIGGCPDGSVPTPEGDCYTRLEQFDARLATLSESVQFTDRTAELTPAARAILDQVVDFIDQYPDLRMVIVGHTDGRGDDERNVQLSQLRANSVRVYLLRQSKDPRDLGRRIDAIGRGATEPIDTNDTAVGRSRNRRVEFWIVQKLQAPSPAEAPLPPSADSPPPADFVPAEPGLDGTAPEEPAPLEPAPLDG